MNYLTTTPPEQPRFLITVWGMTSHLDWVTDECLIDQAPIFIYHEKLGYAFLTQDDLITLSRGFGYGTCFFQHTGDQHLIRLLPMASIVNHHNKIVSLEKLL